LSPQPYGLIQKSVVATCPPGIYFRDNLNRTPPAAADCLTEEDVFYGSDFLSTVELNTTTAKECCSRCNLAVDCTVWNWCGKEGGCVLPPILQSAGNRTAFDKGTCVYKPRPITYAGTLPVPPTANTSDAMQGWTSGDSLDKLILVSPASIHQHNDALTFWQFLPDVAEIRGRSMGLSVCPPGLKL